MAIRYTDESAAADVVAESPPLKGKIRYLDEAPEQALQAPVAAPQDFASQYVQDAQRGIVDRATSIPEALGRALGGLYGVAKGGLTGLGGIVGNVAGDIQAADQLPFIEGLAAKIGAIGQGADTLAQSGAESLARAGFDTGEMIRKALVNQGLKALSNPLGAVQGPLAIALQQGADMVTGRTPSELETALAEKANQDAQLNALAREGGLVPSFTGQQVDSGVSDLGALIAQSLIPGAPKGSRLATTDASLLRAAEASGVPPVIPSGATPRINLPLPPKTSIASKMAEAVQAPIERAKTNIAAKQAEQVAIKSLPAPAQKAISNGIEFRDAELFATASPAEKTILQEMANHAEDFSKSRSNPDPALIVGNQVTKRIEETQKLLKKVGEEQGALTEALPKTPINAEDFAIKQLQGVSGLKGITIGEDGILDFSNTTLSGSGTKAARKELQDHFNDLKGRSPHQLDLLRKEIFNTEFGKIGVTAKNATLDQGLEAIRQGAADAIETVSPQYRALNQKYAQLHAPLDGMAKFFRNVEGAPSHIQDLNASFLARRLTSNAPSNATLSGLLENMEGQLAANGVKFPVSVRKSQDMLNALSRYYDLAHDTGFAGQIQAAKGSIPTSIKGALSKVAGKGAEIVGRTDAVKRKAIQDLIESPSASATAKVAQKTDEWFKPDFYRQSDDGNIWIEKDGKKYTLSPDQYEIQIDPSTFEPLIKIKPKISPK